MAGQARRRWEIQTGFWQSIKRSLAEGFEIIPMILSSLSDKLDAWEWRIAKFEAQDRVQPPQKGAIVFTGSSSVTFWKTLEQDMAPLPVINRGFGGSKIHQAGLFQSPLTSR
jgi:hypothetical protein